MPRRRTEKFAEGFTGASVLGILDDSGVNVLLGISAKTQADPAFMRAVYQHCSDADDISVESLRDLVSLQMYPAYTEFLERAYRSLAEMRKATDALYGKNADAPDDDADDDDKGADSSRPLSRGDADADAETTDDDATTG